VRSWTDDFRAGRFDVNLRVVALSAMKTLQVGRRGEGAAIELARAVRYALDAQFNRSLSALPHDPQTISEFRGIRQNPLRANLAS
jgi:hypothetical protein